LLPDVVALVYGGADCAVNRRRGLALHVPYQVAVDVHGDGDRRMPELLPDHLGWMFDASIT